MERKKDAQIVMLEDSLKILAREQRIYREDFLKFVEASKKDWQDLRNFFTQKIEGR